MSELPTSENLLSYTPPRSLEDIRRDYVSAETQSVQPQLEVEPERQLASEVESIIRARQTKIEHLVQPSVDQISVPEGQAATSESLQTAFDPARIIERQTTIKH